MRSRAVVWIVSVAALGCGNVVETTDGPASDGAAAADSADRDGGADGACAYTCWAQDPNGTTVEGTASCLAPSNTCAVEFDFVESIDVCGCSVGQPTLFVSRTGTSADIVFFGPPTGAGASYSITVGSSGCFGAADPCPSLACAVVGRIFAWRGIPVTPGAQNRVLIYEDLGAGCDAVAIRFQFDVVVP